MTQKSTTSSVFNKFRLDGRTAIITGIGPGIGAHVAQAYAEAGANVVLAARGKDKLERLAKTIRADGGKALPVPCDVGKKEDLDRLVASAQDAFGTVDILFNNAAGSSVAPRKTMFDTTDEDWELALRVNVLAPFKLARALVPGMKKAGRGSIVTVLAQSAFTPIPAMASYGCTKAALAALTRYMARDCAPEVRVNGICPGTITNDGVMREIWKPLMAGVALGRLGWAEEVSATALYLASEASSFITGQIIFVDGGRVATGGSA